jgi:type I restriction enzyme M protein
MRHFATESGKSKGQFYTPAEVSRVIAQVIGIRGARTSAATIVYDPTCGSGSLLLKVGDEAVTAVTLNGQEKDATTAGLARINGAACLRRPHHPRQERGQHAMVS